MLLMTLLTKSHDPVSREPYRTLGAWHIRVYIFRPRGFMVYVYVLGCFGSWYDCVYGMAGERTSTVFGLAKRSTGYTF